MGFVRSQDNRFGYYDSPEEYRRAVAAYDRSGGQGPYPVFSPASVAAGGRPTQDAPGAQTGTDILLGRAQPGRIAPGFEGAGQRIPGPGVDVPGINVPFPPGTINPLTGTRQPGPPRRAPAPVGPHGGSGPPRPPTTTPGTRPPVFPTTQKPQTYEDFLAASPQRLRSIFTGSGTPIAPQRVAGLPILSGQDKAELLPIERQALDAGLLKMGMDPESYHAQTNRLFRAARGGGGASTMPSIARIGGF